MDVAEFDRVADHYEEQHRANIAITGERTEYFAEYKIRVLYDLIQGHAPTTNHILDFGAGIGNSIPYFRQYLPQASVVCADVSRRSLEIMASRFGPDLATIVIEQNQIPAGDASFDAVFSACVFHHILHREHTHWLGELARITRPGGLLVVFEHNPLNPLTVHAVNTCPFDENAHLISARQLARRFRAAGWAEPRIRYHLFFPHALAALRPLEPFLSVAFWRTIFGPRYQTTLMCSRYVFC